MYSVDLKKFRSDNKMTQIQAATYFGCDQSFISQIENGKSKIPDEFITKLLADQLINSNSVVMEPELEYKKLTSIDKFLDIMQKQADSLAVKDEQMNRLITLLENQLNK